jgi:DNA-binding XRE family transcriptional regulator
METVMTGKEFVVALKAAGYTQKRFAEIMGVHRTTVQRQVDTMAVDPCWVYALAGLIAGKAAGEVAELVSKADNAQQ